MIISDSHTPNLEMLSHLKKINSMRVINPTACVYVCCGVFVFICKRGEGIQHAMLINLFDFCQPITDVYCGQLTNESARVL